MSKARFLAAAKADHANRIRLGTRIEAALKPFARLADRLLGTAWTGCATCGTRRDRLNRWSAVVEQRLRKAMFARGKRRAK